MPNRPIIEETSWKLSAQCETKGTEPSGKRNDCDSDESVIVCPQGWVIDDKVYKQSVDKNGTNNRVNLTFHDYVRPLPDVPEIEYPTRVTLSVHARSPGGNSSGRGWTKASIEGRMFKGKQLVDLIRYSLNKLDGN